MGAQESWIRTDEMAGSVDLSILALPEGDYARPESLSFLALNGLWYNLKPLEDTEIQPDDTIYPVQLERKGSSGPSDNLIEAAGVTMRFMKNWLIEGRHFPRLGSVSLKNEVIREGDGLTINGRQTGPLDIAWVTERVDPASDIRPSQGYGLKLPSGGYTTVWTRTVANF